MKTLVLKSAVFPDGQLEVLPELLPLTIGRGKASDITIDDDLLSRKHSELRMTEQGDVEIVDLESMNLTIVNEKDVTSRVLAIGDKLFLGDTEIEVVMVPSPPPHLNDRTTQDLTNSREDRTIAD